MTTHLQHLAQQKITLSMSSKRGGMRHWNIDGRKKIEHRQQVLFEQEEQRVTEEQDKSVPTIHTYDKSVPI